LSLWDILGRLGKVGLPQVPQILFATGSGLVPVFFVGRLKNTEMTAALGLCNVMCNILGFSWIWGITSGINTLSSQDWGAGSYYNIGVTLQRGCVLAFTLAIPLLALWLNSARILDQMGQPPEVAKYVADYTRIRCIAFFTESIISAITRTLASIGNTRIQLVQIIVHSCVNIPFCWLLVPSLQFYGSAIAFLLADICSFIAVLTLACRNTDFKRCWSGFTWKAFHGWLPFLRLSVPAFVLLATEMWSWTLQDFLAGLISTNALAANAIAPSVVITLYCIGGSLSVAATTVVGNLIGEERAGQARRAALITVLLVFPCLTPLNIFLYAIRRSLASVFTEDKVVAKMVTDLLALVQVFSLFDGLQAALTGVINGVGKQAVAAPIISVCYWLIGTPIGVVFAFGFFGIQPLGVFGLWIGMIVAVFLHALSFGVLVFYIDWAQTVKDVKQRKLEDDGNNEDGYELAQLSQP